MGRRRQRVHRLPQRPRGAAARSWTPGNRCRRPEPGRAGNPSRRQPRTGAALGGIGQGSDSVRRKGAFYRIRDGGRHAGAAARARPYRRFEIHPLQGPFPRLVRSVRRRICFPFRCVGAGRRAARGRLGRLDCRSGRRGCRPPFLGRGGRHRSHNPGTDGRPFRRRPVGPFFHFLSPRRSERIQCRADLRRGGDRVPRLSGRGPRPISA